MRKGFLFLIPALILFSCNTADDYITVATGNYSFEQGAYVEANYRYLQALEGGRFVDYISYNLGNVYHDLGSMESALKHWSRVEDSADRDLRFRVAFNRGVLFYGRGDYNQAFSEFRKAIRIGPVRKKNSSMLAAKKNLELSLQKLNMESVPAVESGGGTGRVGERTMNAAAVEMMTIVRQKERLNWEQVESGNPVSVEDY